MSIALKIKSKHLSLEAKVIKFEEAKLLKQQRWLLKHQQSSAHVTEQYNSIVNHRKFEVRNENRATFLARAYIEGIPYKSVEQKRKPENEGKFICYIVPRILSMVQKYGKYSTKKEDILAWLNA